MKCNDALINGIECRHCVESSLHGYENQNLKSIYKFALPDVLILAGQAQFLRIRSDLVFIYIRVSFV